MAASGGGSTMATTRAIATKGIPMRKIFLNIILCLTTPPIPCHSMACGHVEEYARASKWVHGGVRETLTYPCLTLLLTLRASQVQSSTRQPAPAAHRL